MSCASARMFCVGLRHGMQSGGECSHSDCGPGSVNTQSGTGRLRAGTLVSPKQSQSNAL